MLEFMARDWWVLVLRGIAAVILGVAVLAMPGIALSVLVLLWGAYAVVDGIFALVMAFQGRTTHRWITGLEGVISIIAGVATFFWPGITAMVLLYVVAVWAILTGILELIAAIQLRKEISGEFWMGLGGVLSVVFGVLLILFPGAGMLSLLWMLGVYEIGFGIALVILGVQLRRAIPQGDKPQPMQPA
ncbi:MAG: HdeD family acid-resistance protein [Caldilineaceae bacterium]|nr:HdeD family acid-resistance protein [Caldilineaceae bacterium]